MTLEQKFSALRDQGEKALILFVTAGDPDLESLPEIISTLAEAGADAIEVGIPFSDPIGDGPTIQASSQRALDRGVTPTAVLEALKSTSVDIPIVLMGYLNTVLRKGLATSAASYASAGANATILLDLTPEEAVDWVSASQSAGLDNIFLAAPTSTDGRLDAVVKNASGFIYAVSRTGVTGAATTAPPEVESLVSRIRSRTDLPICVGFGISTPEHVRMITQFADGAVVGSWLVDFLATKWNGGAGKQELADAIRALKAATRS